MAHELELPDWCARMPNPPIVTVYAGPEDKAVPWFGRFTRKRFQINMPDGSSIDMDIRYAYAIAEMIQNEGYRPFNI